MAANYQFERCRVCEKTGYDIAYCLMVLNGETKEFLERGLNSFCDEVKKKKNLETKLTKIKV